VDWNDCGSAAGRWIQHHGSDLLLHGSYLEVKLAECRFCFTVSEYNRNYIKRRYPQIDPAKVFVSRLGVDLSDDIPPLLQGATNPFTMLAVGSAASHA
jgi:hypothetical protein